MTTRLLLALTASLLLALASSSFSQTAPDQTPAANAPATTQAGEVTLIGNVLNDFHVSGTEKDQVPFVYVLDGPPAIKAEVDKLLATNYPDKGLDGEAARKLLDLWTAQLKYYIAGPHAAELYKNSRYGTSVQALTGTIREADGKKWINVSKVESTNYQYPAKMLAKDKPFVMPDKQPLVLKINDTLSIKCIYMPPGKFFMGEPYYMAPHWQEDPPHMVTFTKGYYLSETQVTQETFQAVTGNNPCKEDVGPQLPIHDVSCVDMYKFCRLLSEKTGRKIGVPTAAQWAYVARVGTSNPPFALKYTDQGERGARNVSAPVKSKQPNAWGIYDMQSRFWERLSDNPRVLALPIKDATDPQAMPAEDKEGGDPAKKHQHMGMGRINPRYPTGEFEFINSEPDIGVTFRIVVEADAAAGAKTSTTSPSSSR